MKDDPSTLGRACAIGLAVVAAVSVSPVAAAPYVTSPAGPAPGQWAFGVGPLVLFETDDVPIPVAHFDVARGLSRHWDAVGQLDTIGVAGLALAGVRGHMGETLVAGFSARIGVGLAPGLYSGQSVLGYFISAPGLSLGLAGDWGALTASGDVLLAAGYATGVVARAFVTLELDVADAGALSLSGGIVLGPAHRPDERRVFVLTGLGWVW